MPDRDFDGTGYLKFMNEFCDALRTYRLSTTEWALVMHIIRKTWGDRGKAWAQIGFTDFMTKCSMTNAAVSRGTNRLIKRNFIQRKKVKGKFQYKINSKPSTWKPSNPHKWEKKSVTELGVNSITELEQKALQNCNKSITELGVNENSTFKRKDNRKDNGKDTPPPPIENKIYKPPSGAKLKADFPWINETAWNEFLTHRTNIKHKLTELAVTKAVNLLEKWQDHQQQMVDEAILNNWRGLFPPKSPKYQHKQKAKMESTVEVFKRRHDARRRKPPGGS